MKKHFLSSSLALLLAGAFSCQSAFAEVLDRPTGIKIGERMTLRPYVSLSLTYDSNVRARSGDIIQDVPFGEMMKDFKGNLITSSTWNDGRIFLDPQGRS